MPSMKRIIVIAAIALVVTWAVNHVSFLSFARAS